MDISVLVKKAAEVLCSAGSGTNNRLLADFLYKFLGAIAAQAESLSGEGKAPMQRDLEAVQALFAPSTSRVVKLISSYEEFKRSETYGKIQEYMKSNPLYSDAIFNTSFEGSLPSEYTADKNKIIKFLKENKLEDDTVAALATKLSFKIHSGAMAPMISDNYGVSPRNVGAKAYFILIALIENAVNDKNEHARLEIEIKS